MITLDPVVRDDLDALFALDVLPAQRGWVAPNPITLAELSYTTGGYVFTIRRDSEMVGLLAMIDFREHDDLFEDDDPEAAFMMRLMVDAKVQRQGIGRAATAHAIDWARERGTAVFRPRSSPATILRCSSTDRWGCAKPVASSKTRSSCRSSCRDARATALQPGMPPSD